MKNHTSEVLKKYFIDGDDFKKQLSFPVISGQSDEELCNDFFINLPYLFEPRKIFKSDHINKSLIPAMFFYNYILFIDNLVDGGAEKLEFDNLIIKSTFSLILGSIELKELIKNDNLQWSEFKQRFEQYINVIFLEKSLFESKDFNFQTFKKIAIGKHSLIFFYLELLTDRNEDKSVKILIVEMLEIILQGIQLFDDIEDVEVDYSRQTMTYPIYLLNNYYSENKIEKRTFDMKYLCVTGIAVELYKQVNCFFMIAKNTAQKNNFTGILNFLNGHIEICSKKIETISQLIKVANAK